MAPILSLLVPIFCLAVANLLVPSEARAFFGFCDSLVDNGNNDFLATTARADSPPYGIDYPTHRPTGRFSNGLTIPDIICEHMGIESPLPYLHPFLHGERLLGGANFASAGVGILNDTGIQFWYQQRLTGLIRPYQARRLVNQALVLITLGGNDFVNNYYLVPDSARSRQFALPDYVRYLIFEYRKVQVKTPGRSGLVLVKVLWLHYALRCVEYIFFINNKADGKGYCLRQMIGARIKGASTFVPPKSFPASLGRLWVAAAKRDRFTNSSETNKDCSGDVTNFITKESHNCWVPHPESGMFVPPGALAVKGGSGNVTIGHDPSVSKVWVRSTETMEDKDYGN